MPRTATKATPARATSTRRRTEVSVDFAQNNAVLNPYALANLLAGRVIDWSTVEDKPRLLESILQHPYDELFDPKYGGPLYLGFRYEKGQLVRADVPALHEEIHLPSSDVEGADLSEVRVLADLGRQFQTKDVGAIGVRRVVNDGGPYVTVELSLPQAVKDARLLRVFNKDILSSIIFDPAFILELGWTPPVGSWNDGGRFFNEAAEFFDPVQGAVANCYFIASLSAVAWSMPYQIKNMTRATGQNQQQFVNEITFYKPDSGGVVDRQIEVTDAIVLNNGVPVYASSSETGEIWPAVYEKAFACLKTGTTTDRPNILATGWGDCVLATAQLTGGHRNYFGNAGMAAHDIWQTIRGHSLGGRTFHPMTAWTYGSGDDAPDHVNYGDANVVGSHCYTILGWDYRNGTEYVILRNPWGNTEMTVGLLTGTTTLYDISWWRPIALAPDDGTFAVDSGTFKRYFAGFGVVV
jgi:Calpain family cysteine protease